MIIGVNYWGVLVAAAASMMIGAVWYARPVFGRVWAQLGGIKMQGKPTPANMASLLLTQFALSLLTAYILAHFVEFVHYFNGNDVTGSWLRDGVETALWGWLGFTACRLLTHDMFENRRRQLTLLNISFEAVTLVVMGVIIGWLHP